MMPISYCNDDSKAITFYAQTTDDDVEEDVEEDLLQYLNLNIDKKLLPQTKLDLSKMMVKYNHFIAKPNEGKKIIKSNNIEDTKRVIFDTRDSNVLGNSNAFNYKYTIMPDGSVEIRL
jgi:hypothetical protein